MKQLVREEARRVLRAWRAWQWVHDQLEASPPADDGLRHPEVDAEELAAETLLQAVHELFRVADMDGLALIEALVDAGLTTEDAQAIGKRHAAWLLEEEV